MEPSFGLLTTFVADRSIAIQHMHGSKPPVSRTSIKSRMDQIRCTHRNKGTLTERIDPILVPQQAKQLVIQRRLEDLYVQRVVLVRMDTEILNLV